MPTEIERKFLIKDASWKECMTEGVLYKQAYIADSPWGVVRLRQAGEKAFLTLKTRTQTISRQEFEYEIPFEHAIDLFATLDSSSFIEKIRYTFNCKGHIWEIDEFQGSNKGLVIAEIELTSEDEEFEKPSWLGEEVSKISKYFNTNLSTKPYQTWQGN